jgi:hypothetical protein
MLSGGDISLSAGESTASSEGTGGSVSVFRWRSVASFSGSISLTTGLGDTVDRSCVIDLSIGASSSGLRVGARLRWIKQQ